MVDMVLLVFSSISISTVGVDGKYSSVPCRMENAFFGGCTPTTHFLEVSSEVL